MNLYKINYYVAEENATSKYSRTTERFYAVANSFASAAKLFDDKGIDTDEISIEIVTKEVLMD